MDEKLEKIYEAYVKLEDNPETREENLQEYNGLLEGIRKNDLLQSWVDHEQTKFFVSFLKREYRNLNIALATKENLSENDRNQLWGRKKLLKMMLDIVSVDPKKAREQIESDVNQYLSNV